MKLNRRHTAWALAAVAAAPQTWAQAPQSSAGIPLEAFFKRRQLSQAALNPSGTHVALCVGGDGAKRRLVVLELATLKVTPVGALRESDVMGAEWLNDRRILFRAFDEDSTEQVGGVWRGVFAVDLDGSNFKQLRRDGILFWHEGNQSDDALFGWYQDDSEGANFLRLFRVDTRSGADQEIEVPPWCSSVIIDEQLTPIAAATERGNARQIRVRDGKDWRVVRETERVFGEEFSLHGRAQDGAFYVVTRNGKDRTALYTYDPRTDKLSDKPVLGLAQFDIQPQLHRHEGRLLGVKVDADATTTVWFDDAMKAVQARVDAKLGSTNNLIFPPKRGASPWVLVWSYADRQTGIAYAYQRETGRMVLLGRERNDLNPALMSAMDFKTYRARDGREIPAYLTLPRNAGGKRPLPLVVMVHGGPAARGPLWGWQADVQFLASRGYAVLQPEPRGSTGFGIAHAQAGWRQWGQAMQDDIADGAQWLIKEGIADPKRVCILGGSYGGYAAMMGLVKHPDLYACAVNFVGVTDLDLLFSATWDDVKGPFKTVGLAKLVGDRKLDAEMLKANSPVEQAARIGKPVLMAYGRRDQRVPIEHGQRMRDALKGHNPNVEWVVYDKEGHGWYMVATQVDFWTRVERFLAAHMPASA